jgi:DNA-binding Lrp family transcriptional regulator
VLSRNFKLPTFSLEHKCTQDVRDEVNEKIVSRVFDNFHVKIRTQTSHGNSILGHFDLAEAAAVDHTTCMVCMKSCKKECMLYEFCGNCQHPSYMHSH